MYQLVTPNVIYKAAGSNTNIYKAQVISDATTGGEFADSRSQALGDKLSSLEGSVALPAEFEGAAAPAPLKSAALRSFRA